MDNELFAIDVGYSYVKVIDGGGNLFKFHSVVVPYVDDGVKKDGFSGVISLDGKQWLVGNVDEGSVLSINDTFHGSENWRVLLCWAFFRRCYELKTNFLEIDHLALGVPYNQYKDTIIPLLTERKSFDFYVDDKEYSIKINNIRVYPQGLAILANYNEHTIGIVDIGYHTLDVVLMKNKKIIRSRSTSTTKGVNQVFMSVSRVINKTLGTTDISWDKVYRVITTGEIKYKKRVYDFKNEVASILLSYSREIESSVKSLWKDDYDFIDHVIVAGGGAELLRTYLGDFGEIASSSIYSNVTAYMTMLKSEVK